MSISILLQVLRTGGCRGSHSVYGVQNLVQPEQGLWQHQHPVFGLCNFTHASLPFVCRWQCGTLCRRQHHRKHCGPVYSVCLTLQASKKASEYEKSLMSAYNQAKAKLKETYSKSEL